MQGNRIDLIRAGFSRRDVENGEKYFAQGRVTDYRCSHEGTKTVVDCKVRGTQPYQVKLQITPAGWSGAMRIYSECTCPQFLIANRCKHVVAAVCAYNQYGVNAVRFSDAGVTSMLDAYLNRSADSSEDKNGQPARQGQMHLVPLLRFESDTAALALRIGADRLYVVRSIMECIERFRRKEVFRYGKQLELKHDEALFDDTSRGLIAFLEDLLENYSDAAKLISPYSYGFSALRIGSEMRLSVGAFHDFFDLYRHQRVGLVNGGSVMLTDGSPQLSLSVNGMVNGARLKLSGGEAILYSNERESYILSKTKLMRLGAEDQKNLGPLLAFKSDMWINEKDLASFCSVVLPRIQDRVRIDDPDGVLDKHLPDDCTPLFFFDIVKDALTCRLAFDYGGRILEWSKPGELPNVRRNARVEYLAEQRLNKYFDIDSYRRTITLSDPDRIDEFLATQLSALREMGEVYLSDRLAGREVHPVKPSVNVSVSSGILTLEFDTGGFPPEELEALYNSLLQRRRWHRLRDGRVLSLEGGAEGLEQLAEMAHMTQLDEKQLAEGRVTMPACRGLYLDEMLRGENLRVQRDSAFRDMVRRFKTVEDSDFAFPEGIRAELRGYQETGYRWLKTLEQAGFGGILADEMGLGKTLQMIVFLTAHKQANPDTLPSLVVCPTSLVYNWNDEFARFAPDMKIRLILGPAGARKARIADESADDVWVTSYDLLKRDIELYQDREFYCCVLDEGQFVKNQSTLASKAVKRVACRQRFVLTGTPIENRLSELWNLFDFLMPGYLFTHQRFVDRLEKPIVQQGSAEAQEQLKRLVRPFLLRRLKADVLSELPPKQEFIRRVPLSEGERKVYAAQTLAALDSLGPDSDKLQILAALTRLRQICCDPNLCFENYRGETSKLEACMELVESMVENGHQILLFSQFTSMLDILRDCLDKKHISSFTLQGSTPRETRAQLVRRFNAGEASVFLISLKAGGTGLNLTAADVVIHYDPWWNIAAQNQATDRAHRIGQKARVQVYKLITEGTIEEKILKLQEKKAGLLDAVAGEAEEGVLNMSREDLFALLDEREAGA